MTCVSSSGKVLLAGGYLVLDADYSGVVVSTSSRFYTVVRNAAAGGNPNAITVRSPQFLDATWRYTFGLSGETVEVNAVVDGVSSSKNKFVHLALQRTLALALEIKGAETVNSALASGLEIVIVGDNDFYSQRAQLALRNLPPTLASLSELPPLGHANVRLSDVHKTGLGSSAALITSLTSALLAHLSVVPRSSFSGASTADPLADTGRKLAHNLAQYVHCLAQGKVGSGFDVAAAVFGSQLYTRFRPAVLEPLMKDELPAPGSLGPILDPSNKGWDYNVRSFKLPPRTRLMLADVDAGSDSPSMAGKVLKWRKENGEVATALWTALDKANNALAAALLKLSDLAERNPAQYDKISKYISSIQPVQWLANPNISPASTNIVEAFYDVHMIAEGIRAHMRDMGTRAGVPIEPPEQTALINACVAQAGVIAGGVPGAGGYDALWLLVLDPADVSAEEHPAFRVERVWGTWKGLDVSPLSATESVAKGCRIEDIDTIPGLAAALAA